MDGMVEERMKSSSLAPKGIVVKHNNCEQSSNKLQTSLIGCSRGGREEKETRGKTKSYRDFKSGSGVKPLQGRVQAVQDERHPDRSGDRSQGSFPIKK